MAVADKARERYAAASLARPPTARTATESVHVVRAVVAVAVDEERGRARHAAGPRPPRPGRSARRNAPSHVLGEARHVEPESVGVRHQIGHPQLVLVLEQPVVHLPERALIGAASEASAASSA